jgi:hypothetical protein
MSAKLSVSSQPPLIILKSIKFFNTQIGNSGQARTIIGYPTEAILNAIQRVSK